MQGHDAAGQVLVADRAEAGRAHLRGVGTWQPPYAPAGAVQNKVADGAGADRMTLTAALGHACGASFNAGAHLKKHREFEWMAEILRDMPARGWTTFSAR